MRSGISESSTTRRSWVRRARNEEDSGAVLILALIFLVVISVIVGGFAAWTANGLKDAAAFNYSRTANNALNSATQVAIQSIRYNPLLGTAVAPGQTLNAYPPSYCWGTSSPSEIPVDNTPSDGYAIAWCSTVWNPNDPNGNTRKVTISTCLSIITTAPDQCALHPGLQTLVDFDDNPATGTSPPNPGICSATCGIGMTVVSATNNPTLPTVSSVLTNTNGTSGLVTGNYPLHINGTGFVANTVGQTPVTTVNFIATNLSENLVVAAPNITVNSSTSITLSAPAMTTATSYYIVVTTLSGTSFETSASIFTFTQTTPGVVSLQTTAGTAPTGSDAGGTGLSIFGSGFLSNSFGNSTSVTFVDTVAGSNYSVTLPPNQVGVISSNLITVTTPSVSQGTTFYVVVATLPGGTTAPGPVFTYTPLTPVVASISPTSAPHAGGSTVTITGIGFISGGTTVTFVNGGTTLTATGVNVENSTTLTAVTPAGATGTYNVLVTTTSGGSSGSGGTPTIQYT